ncbi:MAG: hypothetical protein HEEMFOPI_01940 [Holosporales bacterium]
MKNTINMKKVCLGLMVAALASGAQASGNRDFEDSRVADDRNFSDRGDRQDRDRSGRSDQMPRANAKRVMLKDFAKMTDDEVRQVQEVVITLADAYTGQFHSWNDLGGWDLLEERLRNVTVILDCGNAKVIESQCLAGFPGVKVRVVGPQVRHIEYGFLSDSHNLEEVDLSSLTNVVTIGGSFLAYSYKLKNVDLTAFDKVIFIDGYFLAYSRVLQDVKLPSFKELKYLGSNYLLDSNADESIAVKLKEIATKNSAHGLGCVVSNVSAVDYLKEVRAENAAKAAAKAANAAR